MGPISVLRLHPSHMGGTCPPIHKNGTSSIAAVVEPLRHQRERWPKATLFIDLCGVILCVYTQLFKEVRNHTLSRRTDFPFPLKCP